jgi:Domain of unknown function (DUF4129)
MSLISLLLRISACAGVQCFPLRPAFAQTAAAIEDAVRNAVTRLDLQTELPGDPQYDWFDLNLPAINFSTGLLWTAIAIAVALALYSVRDDLPRLIFGRSRRWGSLDGEDGGLGDPASHQQAALNADELASQGYYVEAMHVLLLRAFAAMRERLGIEFAASLTSREILRRAKLPETGKAPLRDIINRVELSYFGAYPAADRDYAACRESFDRFMGLLDEQGSRS